MHQHSFDIQAKSERDERQQTKPDRVSAHGCRGTYLQPKLVVGHAADPFEVEADRVATEVMQRLAAAPQREPTADTTRIARSSAVPAHTHAAPPPEPTRIARSSAPPAAVPEVGYEGGDISPDLAGRIRSSAGGAPLDSGVRSQMEGAFGAEFGGVRVHAASPLPERVAAEAFTVGDRIHFAPGRYQPSTPGGQRLLAHELTHVIQQGGAAAQHEHEHHHQHDQLARSLADGITSADTGFTVRRHSSWEHMLIGDLDPDHLATLGAAYDVAGDPNKKVTIGQNAHGANIQVDQAEVTHVIQQEINRLKKFQDNPPTFTTYSDVAKAEARLKNDDAWDRKAAVEKAGGSPADAVAELGPDKDWDVKLVAVPNDSGKTFLVTYGELNTLGDFFGSVKEMKAMDPKWVDQLIRGVRRSTMRELVKVYTAMRGLESDAKINPMGKSKKQKAHAELGLDTDNFKSADGKDNAIRLGGVLNELKLMGKTTAVKGKIGPGYKKPKVGGEASTDYASTLARNACHFAPESWHAWADYHEKARKFAAEAYRLNREARSKEIHLTQGVFANDPATQTRVEGEIEALRAEADEKANEAMLHNGFGDHYLQDSYAAGHLINKTEIMQWYVQWLDTKKNKWDAHLDETWRKVQQMAYNQPGLTDHRQYDKSNVGQNRSVMDRGGKVVEVPSARNPQTAENVDGDWKVKAQALGLTVPSALQGGNSKKLLVAWQTQCVQRRAIRKPREKQVKTLIKLGADNGIGRTDVLNALQDLIRAGVIHFEKYKVSDIATMQDLSAVPRSTVLVLRPEYVPANKKSLQAATASSSIYEDKALGVAYNDYLQFMNSSFLQKATNFLHDKYCKEGLDVEAGDGTPVFKIYGDNNMLQKGSSAGLKHSGETSHRSRNAIMEVIDTGQSADSTQDILTRLPEKVKLDNNTMVGLDVWHSGELKTKCEQSIFESMSALGKTIVINKAVVGVFGSLGKVTKDTPPHGKDVF